ncbi:slx9p [Saccharomyces arboricola H-6]|uniref:Ribosome biogenesis protein SLX9 n=1 Tax=Saccharomyces arboricola (strain H-6 / AS 2.3317 / CBS 10644) TaxID=1160507 RepID=J8Q4X1_SACAR|nr:slx9p [Saccharomyces arboricola H-6]
MGAKKRNTLRGKANARNGQKPESNVVNDGSVDQPYNLESDPKAFLHQPKETKKEKMLNRQNTFLSQLRGRTTIGDGSGANFDGISKSSIRRRKRKQREELKPRMEDLLTSLEQEKDLQGIMNESDRAVDGDNDIDMGPRIKFVDAKEMRPKKVEPGSIKIKKNQPNMRNQKGAKALSANETARFNQILTNQDFQKNPFGALREIIKLQKQ